jgi:Concanavalin A-like lectin/glucanases superfamily
MKKRIFTLVAFLFFLLSALDSNASHFRFGHISWTRTPGTRNVTFTVTTAWKYDYTDPVTLTFGDGTSSASSYGTEILYVPNEYRVFQAQFTHTYSSDGPFTVSYGSCCRISTLQNGADDSYIFSTVVCLGNNNLGSPAYSPSSPVVIEMTDGRLNQIQLVAPDPDGSTISYSTSAILGANYVPTIGGNVASVSTTGLVSWNTTGATAGQLYQMKVNVSDGCARSEIDFIIKIVTSCIPTATISGSQIIIQGANANLNLTFTGNSPWTYRLSGTSTDVTTSVSPTTITLTPPSTTTYTLTSVSNSCGAGTTSGNAEVTVASPIDLITCQPLDGNVTDQVGYNNGSVITNGGSNSYVTNRNGTANTALSISNGSYVEFPVVSLLNNSFTHSVWVSPASLPASGSFAYILSVGGIGLSQDLYLENQGGVVKWVFTSSTTNGYIDVKSQGAITVGQWYHLAMVRTASDLQLYVNGVLAQSVPATGLTSLYASSSVVRIGTKSSGLVYYFNGKVDDVRLYKGGMSSTDITSLYNTTLNCPTITGSQVISLTNITDNTLCKNQVESVNFLQNGITIGSTYSVLLSDVNGSFANPTTIGSGTASPIQVSIPNTITTSGTGYLIRIVNGTTTSYSTLPITIFPTVTGVITGTASFYEGQSTNLTIYFTGTSPWSYSIFNGQSSTSYTSTTPAITQSVSPLTTTTYSLSSVSDNTCGTGTVSGSAVLTFIRFTPQLLACYKFNGNALDSKSSKHGTVNGATLTTDRFGKANSAYSFNGINNYISIPGVSLGESQYTYAAWVNASNTTAYSQTIISIGGDGSDQAIALTNVTASNPNWNFFSYIYYAALPIPQVLSTNNVTTSQWHFVVATRTINNLTLYIDGNKVGTVSSTGVAPAYATPIAGAIGSRYRADIQFFTGKIDDVKIYTGALTDEEVLLLYNEEQGECSSPCSGMIYSLGSGDWDTPATWSCGRVPNLSDKVLIKSGHNITISTNNANAKKLLNSGRVSFVNTTSRLTFGNN